MHEPTTEQQFAAENTHKLALLMANLIRAAELGQGGPVVVTDVTELSFTNTAIRLIKICTGGES